MSSLCIKIPNVPGKLGEVSSLIGFHRKQYNKYGNRSKKD